jgi:hypothetical protein
MSSEIDDAPPAQLKKKPIKKAKKGRKKGRVGKKTSDGNSGTAKFPGTLSKRPLGYLKQL